MTSHPRRKPCVAGLLVAMLALIIAPTIPALERPDVTFKVFQFPADRIPRIDGDAADWVMVPAGYAVRTDPCGVRVR
ncbi:hypothetical protein [Horticoccus sp. 23ND18S-11]|uniref:hypothetical protein n=1 Tax=Horticoccus sp. 23ND18S-11 TaxID=3391832 RepID=UPI0039C9F661